MALTRGMIRNAATTPLDARLMDAARLTQNLDGSVRTGILGTPATLVSATGTTTPMTVSVAAASIVASKGIGDGAAVYTNDGVTAVTIPAAPGANSRIDVIWTRHQDDTTGDTAGLATPIFGVTSGAANATPTKPAIPTGAVELATLRIYSGTTATNGGTNVLTNTYQMTAAQGGLVPFRTAIDLLAWATAPEGTRALDLATGDIYQRLAGTWFYGGGTVNLVAPSTVGLGSGVTLQAVPGYIAKRGGYVELHLKLARTAKLVGSGAEILGTLPAGLRPAVSEPFSVYVNSGVGRGFGWGVVDSAGVMTVLSPFIDATSVTGAIALTVIANYAV